MVANLITVLHNESALAIVAAALGLLATLLGLDGPHWERKFAAAYDDSLLRRDAEERLYKSRPSEELYRLVPRLALRQSIQERSARYVARAERFDVLDEALKREAVRLTRSWIASVGAFAEEMGTVRRVALRPFLATNHLAVIRQGVVAVPMAMSLMADDLLTEDEEVRLAWGVALMELAVRYNSVTRQQREPVYFAAQGHEPAIGPVLRSPGSVRRRYLDIVDTVPLNYVLRRGLFRRSDKWVRSVVRQIKATREALDE